MVSSEVYPVCHRASSANGTEVHGWVRASLQRHKDGLKFAPAMPISDGVELCMKPNFLLTAGRILFVSREPLTHARHGSTTAANNLLSLLTGHGARVDVLVTLAKSRSPRLFFRHVFDLPEQCVLHVPGYVRVGGWFVRAWTSLPWMRAAARMLQRHRGLAPLAGLLQWLSAGRLCVESWDLTAPGERERALLRDAVQALQPGTVIANYAFWGTALGQLRGPHRAILMHDLLSEHVSQFQRAGLPLDCPPVSRPQEIAWLDQVETLIAAQRCEAEAIRAEVSAKVFTQPIPMEARAASAAPDPLRCLFVGSNSPPNVQALAWLMKEVWPLVLRREPEAVLAVAGTVCERVFLPGPGVEMMGALESLAAEHDRAAICLVPLRGGSGIKVKLLEALSYGKATVATTVGVQGLEDWAAGVVGVADQAEEFADAVVHLLRNPELRRQREKASTALVRKHFAAGSRVEVTLVSRFLPKIN